MKVVAFIPIKLNSERLPMKNIRSFTNGNPLLYYILNTVSKSKLIDEIYVYCSDNSIINYLPKQVKFLKRDSYYDLSTTPFNEVLSSFASIIDADIYVLCHATAPFISLETIEKGLNRIIYDKYDSAFTVTTLQEFIWKSDKPYNYSLDFIPRTQDIEKLSVETCGLYIFVKDLIISKNRRIGTNPYLINVNKIEACDINSEEDFIIADAIFNYMKNFDIKIYEEKSVCNN